MYFLMNLLYLKDKGFLSKNSQIRRPVMVKMIKTLINRDLYSKHIKKMMSTSARKCLIVISNTVKFNDSCNAWTVLRKF